MAGGLYLTFSSFDVPAQDWQQMPPQLLAQYRQRAATDAMRGQIGQGLLVAGILGIVGCGIGARLHGKRAREKEKTR
jgi:hypothetical protein